MGANTIIGKTAFVGAISMDSVRLIIDSDVDVLIVDSSGGSVAAAVLLRDVVVDRGLTVIFVGDCSSAAMYLLGASKDEHILKKAKGVSHRPSTVRPDGTVYFPQHEYASAIWSAVKRKTGESGSWVTAIGLRDLSFYLKQRWPSAPTV
jgi:hypothetical protein